MKKPIMNFLAEFGVGLHRLESRKKKMFRHYGVTHVLDVGANTGQYARMLRKHVGFAGEIVSFEPLSSAYEKLKLASSGDPKWKAVNCGLGSKEETLEINISGNSVSSSFLSMMPSHQLAAPSSEYISHEPVSVRTLDSVFKDYCDSRSCVYLKVDTQGYEKQVIDGGLAILHMIDTVEMELSLVPLYQGQLLFEQMCEFMCQLGYELVGLEPGFSDPDSGRLLQVDGVFHKV